MRVITGAFALLIILEISTAVAWAESKAAAREFYQEGTKHYDLGQFNEALESFKRAYWNYEDPALLFNIAQCHRALGHHEEAAQAYRSYLRRLPNAPNRVDVQRVIAKLDADLAQARVTTASPPQGTLEPLRPAGTVAPPTERSSRVVERAPVPVADATSQPRRTPVHKRWWLWTAVGLATAGTAVGLVVGLTRADREPTLTSVTVP